MFDYLTLLHKVWSKVSLWYLADGEGLKAFLIHLEAGQGQLEGQVCPLPSSLRVCPVFRPRGVGLHQQAGLKQEEAASAIPEPDLEGSMEALLLAL